MGKLAVVVAVAALGAAGWSAWSLEGMRKDLGSLRGEVELLAPLEARIAALEAARGAAKGPTPPPALPNAARPPETEASLLAPAPRAGAAATGATGAPPPAARVEELEKRLAALEEKDRAEASTGDAVARGAGHLARMASGRAFYATPEDAAKDLELDPAQRSDFDRIVADAKRELEDLRRLPDEEGKSYEQIQKEMVEGMRDGALRFDLGKVLAWNGKTIPGRNETFGAADRRIRENAKARLRETLRPEQQAKLDKAVIDPLLGRGGGPGMVMSFSTVDVLDASPAGK